ncbi:MAG TPA: hypothetical protein VEU97_12600 [Ktedonobacteraceae bacterium]|nr:hypothetical protein [Ktedonobacteraceae bacterium]
MRNALYSILAWLGIGAIVFGAVTFVVNNLKAFPDASDAYIPLLLVGLLDWQALSWSQSPYMQE